MSCSFETYKQLRAETATKADAAEQACTEEADAQQALQAAQTALSEAQTKKTNAYAAWQESERAENAEAKKLGIEPCPD